MHYRIRLAEADDVAFLPAIERAAAEQFVPYVDWLKISTDLLKELTTPRFLRKAQTERRLWVAVVAGQPVGFVVVKFLLKSCFIVELDVHPDYVRQGIGSALVEACCLGAQAQGFGQVTLTTFRKVPWNIPFYRRLGFEVLPADRWSIEIRAIVQHEARYGFAAEKRAVMSRSMPALSIR